jgi:DNA helicase-2/ATP-dependent DNA helicase PcrA
LKLLDNYHESTAMFRVLSIPTFGVPATDLIELTHTASRTSRSLFETLKIAPTLSLEPATQAFITKLLGWMTKHAEAAKRQAGSLIIRDFLTDSGLLAEYTKADDRKSQERVVLLNQFFKAVTEFESSVRDRSVRALVRYLDLAIEAGDDGRLGVLVDEGPESIKVMTVHAAKGLEFPFVFLVQLVDKRFPSVGRKEPIDIPDALVREPIPQGDIHIEEERRLFYVGLTRAKTGIFLTRALDYGGSREKKPSAFLYELGLLEKPAKKVAVARPSRLANAPVVAQPTDREPAYRALVAKDNTFNFSKLITYERCPWQYRYAYVLKVPARPSHAAVFGQAMHQTLQAFFHLVGERSSKAQGTLFGANEVVTSKKPVVSWEELSKLYDQNFREEWYPSRRLLEQYREQGRQALKLFYDAHDGQFQATHALEKDFRIRLEPFRISGRIDRIDRVGGTEAKPEVEIVDYKTGKPQDKLATDDRYQLMIYYAAASDPDVLNLDVKKLTYHYLNDNSSQSYEPKPEDADKVKEWARGIIVRIKSGDFHATPNVQVCKHCDFRDICPYRAV